MACAQVGLLHLPQRHEHPASVWHACKRILPAKEWWMVEDKTQMYSLQLLQV